MANCVEDCRDALSVIAGHDEKDGTSHSDKACAMLKKDASRAKITRIAVVSSLCEGIDDGVKANLDSVVKALKEKGVEVAFIESDILALSKPAWNVLMSAELCNNVSRYDGVKFGYRAKNFSGIDELYTNSRTEAFGELLKTTIIFGSETLSTENYMKVYDKCLRTRRVIANEFAKIFSEYDVVIAPACSSLEYTEKQVKENKHLAFEENFYTAPASITGLPVVVAGGVQMIGKAFSENALLDLALLVKGDK